MTRWLVLLLALLGLASSAQAHLTPNSELRLAFGPDAVTIDMVIPQGEYAYATGLGTADTAANRAAAAAYLARSLAARAPDGRAWRVTIEQPRFVRIAGPPDLTARAVLTPPPGAPSDRFALEWHAVTREVPTHFALAVEGGDLTGAEGGGRRLIGALTAARPTLSVARSGTGLFAAFVDAIRLGAAHIAEGHDHLLFLLALLLPAPLLADRRRWRAHRTAQDTLRHLAWVVTGFTLGHSITLIGATLLGAHLPAAPVEIAIALSVLVSAIHAARPLFPGREPLVAAGFGLVHGLAFATVVADLGVLRSNRAVAILGFNLGIEGVQLAIVLACLPAILWLTAPARSPHARTAAAALIAGAALVWIAERVTGHETTAGTLIAAVLPWVFVLIAGGSLAAILHRLVRERAGALPRIRLQTKP